MTISMTDTALEKEAIGRYARRSCRLRVWLAFLYCGIFLISSTGFYVFWYTDMFNDYLLSHLELRNGTRTFDWWLSPPIKIKYKIYIFNYTNVNEFEAGEESKLRVQELGPYEYLETQTRTNVELDDNGMVTFQTKRTYEWIGGQFENDTVVIPNIPLMVTLAYVRDLSFAVRWFTNTLLSTIQEKPFISETVGGYLWGYDTQLFLMAKPVMKIFEHDVPDKFGLLAGKEGLDADRITINTGSQGVENLGVIKQVNGVDNRHIWGDERCDKIGGTEGSMFPPHLIQDTSKPLYVYSKDICRKIPFHFAEHTTTYDIPSLRYKFTPDAYNFTDEQNKCFCPKIDTDTDTRVCPPSGLFNISACNFGVPLLLSFPHFYGADKSLLEQVDGLNPQQEAHESYIDVHPRVAVTMRGWSRMQVNLEVRKVVAVPFLGNLKDGTILPLIWIDVGADEVSDEVLDVFQSAYFTAAHVELALQWGSLITMILSLSAVIACLWKYHSEHDVAHERTTFIHNNPYKNISPFLAREVVRLSSENVHSAL